MWNVRVKITDVFVWTFILENPKMDVNVIGCGIKSSWSVGESRQLNSFFMESHWFMSRFILFTWFFLIFINDVLLPAFDLQLELKIKDSKMKYQSVLAICCSKQWMTRFYVFWNRADRSHIRNDWVDTACRNGSIWTWWLWCSFSLMYESLIVLFLWVFWNILFYHPSEFSNTV